jgi:peroxiredoxin
VFFIAIASDSKNHLQELSDKFGYTFPLVSDRGAKIAKKFDVYTFGSAIDIIYLKTKLAIPSTFLISNDLKIVWRYIGTREDRPSIKLLTEQIDKKL